MVFEFGSNENGVVEKIFTYEDDNWDAAHRLIEASSSLPSASGSRLASTLAK